MPALDHLLWASFFRMSTLKWPSACVCTHYSVRWLPTLYLDSLYFTFILINIYVIAWFRCYCCVLDVFVICIDAAAGFLNTCCFYYCCCSYAFHTFKWHLRACRIFYIIFRTFKSENFQYLIISNNIHKIICFFLRKNVESLIFNTCTIVVCIFFPFFAQNLQKLLACLLSSMATLIWQRLSVCFNIAIITTAAAAAAMTSLLAGCCFFCTSFCLFWLLLIIVFTLFSCYFLAFACWRVSNITLECQSK